jgi:phosphate-selective porin OprO and OprP
MKIGVYGNHVSLLAISAAALVFAQPGLARAQSANLSQLQSELNSLQAQINALKTQQAALDAQQAELKVQARRQAEITQQQAVVAHQQLVIADQQLLATSKNQWYIAGTKPIPEFITKDGKSTFTIGGQVEIDAGVGSIPGQPGHSGGVDFRRIEFYIEGVYMDHFLYKVENDWTKTSTPLGGLLDVYIGYQHKIGRFDNVFLAGNQHTPFGFQTSSDATLFLENEMGNTLFQDNRQLGLTGQTYNKKFNAWYGITGTNNGTQTSAATATTVINPGTTAYSSQYTASTVLAWNVFNTPGHLLSLRDSVAYNHYNGNKDSLNEPTFSTTPDLNIYGMKFISTGPMPIQSDFVESPRIDFEDNRLTLAAVYYNVSTQSNVPVSKTNHRALEPHFSSWDVEAQYFLTDDHEPFSDYHGYYDAVQVNDPVTDGGPGAIQLAARIDEANLNDVEYGIHGGNETNLTLGVNWWPTSYSRVNVNYVRMFPIGGTSLATNHGKSANILAIRLEYIY